MLISKKSFLYSVSVDLTNFEHKFPHLTLGLYDGATEDSMIQYEIWNYMTNEPHMSFENLRQAVDYCNANFDTNFSYSL